MPLLGQTASAVQARGRCVCLGSSQNRQNSRELLARHSFGRRCGTGPARRGLGCCAPGTTGRGFQSPSPWSRGSWPISDEVSPMRPPVRSARGLQHPHHLRPRTRRDRPLRRPRLQGGRLVRRERNWIGCRSASGHASPAGGTTPGPVLGRPQRRALGAALFGGSLAGLLLQLRCLRCSGSTRRPAATDVEPGTHHSLYQTRDASMCRQAAGVSCPGSLAALRVR